MLSFFLLFNNFSPFLDKTGEKKMLQNMLLAANVDKKKILYVMRK